MFPRASIGCIRTDFRGSSEAQHFCTALFFKNILLWISLRPVILSASMMLRHVGEASAAMAIDAAIAEALAEGCATTELGGSATTAEFTQAVVSKISQVQR